MLHVYIYIYNTYIIYTCIAKAASTRLLRTHRGNFCEIYEWSISTQVCFWFCIVQILIVNNMIWPLYNSSWFMIIIHIYRTGYSQVIYVAEKFLNRIISWKQMTLLINKTEALMPLFTSSSKKRNEREK